jgi:hypothetical protein
VNWLGDLVAQIGDRRIPGGCDRCDAYQTMKVDPNHDGIFYLAVNHDDWRPFLRAREGKNI